MLNRALVACGVAIFAVMTAAVYAGVAQQLSERDARRLIAHTAGIELDANAVTIKGIDVQLGSAVVVAQVETAFRLTRDEQNRWRVNEVRLGDNVWENVDLLARAINSEKTERARAELETVATALDAFRRERGSYLPVSDHAALIDHLSPRYLARVIRLDPWRRPYTYEGNREQFRLASVGADGINNTPDDVIIIRDR